MARFLGDPTPEVCSLHPLTSASALLRWKAALLMASRLNPSQREYWRQRYADPTAQLEGRDDARPWAFDAHFYLDCAIGKMQLEAGSSLTAVLNATFVPAGKEVQLVGSCASFCDPRTYPTSQELEAFPAEMEVAVGLHPQHCATPPRRGQSIVPDWLGELVRSPRVKAFGEIGLDHSLPSQTWHWQISALEELLEESTTNALRLFSQ
ncbi:uncharacterized protein LOC143289625 [Babylonia areolata]|uniref:uncharacterized protein LOC143289625 n=1 Tax=Babylonia areolata TaxID=304850 RepID=UPI003FCF81EC